MDVVEMAWKELEPILEPLGTELVHVEYKQERAGWVLRLYIDREEGVKLDDCQKTSRLLSPVLDEWEELSDRYTLEVSSPGFDRPISKEADFLRFVGEPVKVRTTSPVDGRRKFRGVLAGLENGCVIVEGSGRTFRIPRDVIAKANLDK